jgi:hypothetical protein
MGRGSPPPIPVHAGVAPGETRDRRTPRDGYSAGPSAISRGIHCVAHSSLRVAFGHSTPPNSDLRYCPYSPFSLFLLLPPTSITITRQPPPSFISGPQIDPLSVLGSCCCFTVVFRVAHPHRPSVVDDFLSLIPSHLLLEAPSFTASVRSSPSFPIACFPPTSSRTALATTTFPVLIQFDIIVVDALLIRLYPRPVHRAHSSL